MPTTEVIHVRLIEGIQIGDPASPGAQALKDSFETLKQQSGMQKIRFGTWVEDPQVMQLMMDWDSKQNHDDFTNSAAFGPFLEGLRTIYTTDAKLHHVDFQPEGSLARCLSAPVTEVATFFFDGAPESDYLKVAEEFCRSIEGQHGQEYGVLGWALGLTHEEIEKDGVKGKGSMLTIGWESVEKHMAFRQSQIFKDQIHKLRGTAKGIEMHHVAFMQAQ